MEISPIPVSHLIKNGELSRHIFRIMKDYLKNRGCKARAGIFKKSMEARHRVGIGLSYRPARLYRLAELVPWNRFLGSINV
jgi:hypothetical protein